MSSKKSTYSPRSSQGVNFFSHFPPQRLRPYGKIKEATSDTTMLEKATKLNCEYLVRPAVALSEMAETVSSNVGILKQALRNTDEDKIIREVEKLNDVSKMFNTRSDLPVTSSDVHRLLKYAIDNDDDDSDETFDQMEHVGMLLYVIGSHQKQLQSLIRNPAEYSKKCEDLPLKHEFKLKLNADVKSLKNWWASETVTSESKSTVISASYKKNLLADLGSDSDSDQESRKQNKKKGRKRPERAVSPSSSSGSSKDDEPPPKKKRTEKKKPRQLELSDDELSNVPGPSGVSVWSPQQHESQEDTTSSKGKKKSKKNKSKKP